MFIFQKYFIKNLYDFKNETYVDFSIGHQWNGFPRIHRFNVNGLESDQFALTDVFRVAHFQYIPFACDQCQPWTYWNQIRTNLGLNIHYASVNSFVGTHSTTHSPAVLPFKCNLTYVSLLRRISQNESSHWHSHLRRA